MLFNVTVIIMLLFILFSDTCDTLFPADLADRTSGSQHFLSLAYCCMGGGRYGPGGGGGTSCVT